MGCGSSFCRSTSPLEPKAPAVSIDAGASAPADLHAGQPEVAPPVSVAGTVSTDDASSREAAGQRASSVPAHQDEARALDLLEKGIEALEQIGKAPENPILKSVVDAFQAGGETFAFLANMAIPPPGGQVIGAVVTLAYTVLRSARNMVECRELALKTSGIMVHIIKHKEQIQRSSKKELSKELRNFEDVVDRIQNFCDEVSRQNWLKRVLNLSSIAETVLEYGEDLDAVVDRLQLGLQLEVHEMVANVKAEGAAVEDVIKSMGGVDKLLDHPEAIKQIQGLMSGGDKATFAVTSQILLEFKDFKANSTRGPHRLLKNKSLKNMWLEVGVSTDSMKWELFLSAFPDDTIAPEDIKIKLREELETETDKVMFKMAVELEDPANVSVHELKRAFPDESDETLVERVRTLKEQVKTQSMKVDIGDEPTLFGRSSEVQELVELLHSGQRVVVVRAGPGEGKVAVSVKAAYEWRRKYEVKGAAYLCDLGGVETADALISRLTDSLWGAAYNVPAENKLRSKLCQLNGLDHVLLVLTHYDRLPEGHDGSPVQEELHTQIKRMLKGVKNMQIIITTQKWDGDALTDLDSPVKEVQLKPFTQAAALELMLAKVKGLKESDARVLLTKFSCNPQVLNIVSGILKNEEPCYQNDLVKELSMNYINDNDDEEDFKKADMKLRECFKRSIDQLPESLCDVLLKCTVFPADFSLECCAKVLDITERKAKAQMKTLEQKSLVSIRDERYVLASMVRDYARLVMEQKCEQAQKEIFQRTASNLSKLKLILQKPRERFVEYCSDLMQAAFTDYMKYPITTFNSLSASKLDIQQAVLMGSTEKLALPCRAQYLLMLPLLPYVEVCVKRDAQEACRKLGEEFEKEGAEYDEASGCCFAIASLLNPANEQTSVAASLELAMRAQEKLKIGGDGSDTPKRRLWLAMAMRSEGVLLRFSSKHQESVNVHKEALELIGGECSSKDLKYQWEMERMILLAEMAGTMDYEADQYPDGLQTAKEAVEAGKALLGEDADHPILAKCLTAYGYWAKGEGERAKKEGNMEKAHDLYKESHTVHETALKSRRKVLGKMSLDTALSLNQTAIALKLLGKYQDAEEDFKESLEIRQSCLESIDVLIGNTHNQMGEMYVSWGKLEEAEDSYRRALAVYELAYEPGDGTIKTTAEELTKVLLKNGKEEAAAEFAEYLS